MSIFSCYTRIGSLLYRGIRNYLTKRPLAVSFEVTHSCNARCKHCHLGGPVNEVRASPKKFGEICQELSPLVAQVSGGEPLLRKDLEQIIRMFKKPNHAPYIVVTTNATLLSVERYRSLREAGVDEFSISLDYPDERHDEFRGVPGLFNKIKQFVKDLEPYKEKYKEKPVSLCCVIQSDNFRSLPQMAELAQKWKVKLNLSAYTTLRTHDQSYMLSKEELEEFKEIARQLIEFRKRNGVIRTSEYVFNKMFEFFDKGYTSLPCRTGERFFNVNPDGTISPCGLIIKNYGSRRELIENFSRFNTCRYCYTSIRASTEKPLWKNAVDNLKFI